MLHVHQHKICMNSAKATIAAWRPQAYEDPRYNRHIDQTPKMLTASAMCVPQPDCRWCEWVVAGTAL